MSTLSIHLHWYKTSLRQSYLEMSLLLYVSSRVINITLASLQMIVMVVILICVCLVSRTVAM